MHCDMGSLYPPVTGPELVHTRNSSTVRRHLATCKQRVLYDVAVGAVRRLQSRPTLCQPLHAVLRPARKPRVVLNLRPNLNQLLPDAPFQYQRFTDAVRLATPGCFFAKLDLSDCFHSFPVAPASSSLLTFELDGDFFQYVRLPFGLITSPFWCERFLGVLDHRLRRSGVTHVRYVDDFFLVGPSAAAVSQAMATLRQSVLAFGLCLNDGKTEGPVQRLTFLGVGIDAISCTLYVDPDKVHNIRSVLLSVRSSRRVTRKALQSLCGKLSFAAQAVPSARPFFHSLLDRTRGLPHPWSAVRLFPADHEDLEAWAFLLRRWNNTSRWRPAEPVVLHHDASRSANQGGFGFILESLPADFPSSSLPLALRGGYGFAGVFAGPDVGVAQAESIQWSELFALVFSVALYAPFVRDRDLLLVTDNIADVHIVNRRRTAQHQLLRLLRLLCTTCMFYNIGFRAEHVAGVDNVTPDFLSRPELHAHAPLARPPATHRPIRLLHIRSSLLSQVQVPGGPAGLCYATISESSLPSVLPVQDGSAQLPPTPLRRPPTSSTAASSGSTR